MKRKEIINKYILIKNEIYKIGVKVWEHGELGYIKMIQRVI